MSISTKIIVPTDNVAQAFKKHLALENNKRILFSAPFGAGKSFFLSDFFNEPNDNLSLVIHPVDYAVSNNEDIFELIKFDILTALIDQHFEKLDLADEQIPDLLIKQEYVRNRMEFWPIIKEILPLMVADGEKIKNVIDLIEEQVDNYKEFKEEVNNGEEAMVMKYLVSHRVKKGSIREDGDYITNLIQELISRIKAANKNKPFIFILDDLDRLDPEHVFRLFNVFTAHHNSKTDKNKFDFDQVIFVCDMRNIHYMFQHKYGVHTDFQGYIDKFYSSYIFIFDFKAYIKENLHQLLLDKYNFEAYYSDGINETLYNKYDFKKHRNDFGSIIQYILADLVEIDQVKMRNFERFTGYNLPNYNFKAMGKNYGVTDFPFLILVFTLQRFFPRYHELKEALKRMSETFSADYEYIAKRTPHENIAIINRIIEFSIPFVLDLKTSFMNKDVGEKNFKIFNEYGVEIWVSYYITEYSEYKFTGKMQKVDQLQIEEQGGFARPNPYWFMLKAFEECEKNGFLKAQ